MINEETLKLKARKKIIVLLIAGIAMLIFDYMYAEHSNSITLLNDNQGLYMIRPNEGESSGHILLNAEVEGTSDTYSKNFEVTIDPYAAGSEENINSEDPAGKDDSEEMSREELTAYEVRSIVNNLNDDTKNRKILLPGRLSNGDTITWKTESKSNTAVIAFAVLAIAVFIYRNRLGPLKTLQKSQQQSITRQLPEFVNRLVLLLNAGLVLNSAFEAAVKESNGLSSTTGDFFYGQMREIYSKVKQTNGSMNREFREFARMHRSAGGDTAKELMRISNIISDNISKGVELTDKLQRESETLWLNRKRDCEERGRLAETKLTLPLTFFLLVLIVITVSPALLEL